MCKSMQLIRRIALLLLLSLAWPAQAACTDTEFMDPINDIAWDCIFPVAIMGIPFDYGEHPPDDEPVQIFCECPGKGIVGFGFMVHFWEPARMVDTVRDAWCFPAMGMDFGDQQIGQGYSGAGTYGNNSSGTAFAHYHYYIMPVWAILDLFTDIPCLTAETTFDLAMVSEVRPDWHDDLLAAQLYPETSLMGNPAVVMACAADAVAAAFGRTIDALYWCQGSWGTTYPMAGTISASSGLTKANAGIAGKALFVQARTGQLIDRGVNYCAPTPLPIWIKSHWRIQELDPVVDSRCHNIGRPAMFWTHFKNPIGSQENFSWLLFRKVNCCVVLF